MSYNDSDNRDRRDERRDYDSGQQSFGGDRRGDDYGNDQSYGGGEGRHRGEEFSGRHEEGGADNNRHDNRQENDSYGGGRREDSYGGDRPDNSYERSGHGGRRDDDQSFGSGRRTGEAYGQGDDSFDRPQSQSQYGSSSTSYGGGAAYGGSSSDFSGADSIANEHAGSSGDSNLFSTALGLLAGKKQQLQDEDLDEQDMVRQHQNAYGSGNSGQMSDGNLGAAAAMQALKMFTGGQSDQAAGKGGAQNAIVGMAMGQAAQLFDQQKAQGNTSPGANKQEVVAQAAQFALKMFLKSEMGGTGGASGSSSSMSGLLQLAGRFLQ